MLLMNQLLGFGTISSSPFVVSASDFNGTTGRMDATITIPISSKGIFSGWIRLDGGNASDMEIWYTNGTNNIARNASNKFCIIFTDSVGTTKLDMNSSTSYTANAAWRHILASWDMSGTPVTHLYMDGVSDKVVNTATTTSDLTYAKNNSASIGARNVDQFLDGCMSEIYFNTAEYLDLSIQANRDKFRDPVTGKPVFLGASGAIPTGTIPTIYFRSTADVFEINSGSGGNFTRNGTIVAASTTPAT